MSEINLDSSYMFNYMNDMWDLLPEQDRIRFAELWKAYEQCYGDLWVRIFERELALTIQDVPLYNNYRWMKHSFDRLTEIKRPARFRTNQDLSKGINLSSRFLIKISVNENVPFEVDLRGENQFSTTIFEVCDKINFFAGFKFARPVASNALIEFTSNTQGSSSKITFLPSSDIEKDAAALILGLDPEYDLPVSYPKYPYEFSLSDDAIARIPKLQTHIHEDKGQTLYDQNDYIIDLGSGVISFKQPPPSENMWARDTMFNLETPYNNYGFFLDIYDKNTPNYLKAVKGLWYAFWNGPRPENIKRSLCLLFGLPTANGRGVVTKSNDFIVEVRYDNGSIEIFDVPSELTPVVVVGDIVTKDQPLVDGIEVYDKVNYPGFLRREVGALGVKPFLTQFASRGPDGSDEQKAMVILEENTYLPQISVNAFISPDIKLSNVRTFLSTIQPKSRMFLFQVLVGSFRDKLPFNDEGLTKKTSGQFPNGIPSIGLHIQFEVVPNLDWNPSLDAGFDQLNSEELAISPGLRLDDAGFTHGDRLEVQVRKAGVLTDIFDIQG